MIWIDFNYVKNGSQTQELYYNEEVCRFRFGRLVAGEEGEFACVFGLTSKSMIFRVDNTTHL